MLETLLTTPMIAQAATIAPLSKWFFMVIALGGLGVFLCTQGLGQAKGGKTLATIGCLIVLAALAIDGAQQGFTIERSILLAFGWLAVFGGIGFISFRQPVHAALGFAVSVLAACGVYMMLAAPFLAAATTIIYAGATIIIFLFVLMFASTKHLETYEVKLSSPWIGVSVATILLIQLLSAIPAMPLEAAGETMPESVSGLGTTFFTKYLWTVELAGTLLLVATVGAIMIAQRDPVPATDTQEGMQ